MDKLQAGITESTNMTASSDFEQSIRAAERRKMTLSDNDIERLATKLQEFSGLTAEQHKEQHDAIAIIIRANAKKEQRWEKINESLLGWIVIGFIGGVGTIFYTGFKDFFVHLIK